MCIRDRDGVTQVSGATANDFTAPVDYIVSNGKQNVKYTITVAKSSNMAWVRMPDFTATSVFSGSVLKINPVDQVPYLGFKLKEEEKMAVIKLVDGTTWTAVGSLEGFGGEVSLSNYDFDIDKDGIPYVVYSDNSATTVAGLSLIHILELQGQASLMIIFKMCLMQKSVKGLILVRRNAKLLC